MRLEVVVRPHKRFSRNTVIERRRHDKSKRDMLDQSVIEHVEAEHFKLEAATRAQAEMAIAALAGVQSATVTASKPKRSVFRDRDRETAPQATVSLRLPPEAAFDAVARNSSSLASDPLGIPMSNVVVFYTPSPGQRQANAHHT